LSRSSFIPACVAVACALASLSWSPGVRAQASAPRAWSHADAPAHPDNPSIIPHTLEGRADCLGCHGPAGAHPFPKDHESRSATTCLACHVSAVSPRATRPAEAVPSPVTNNY
jgi:predicted CXXCH cytochrome family protein